MKTRTPISDLDLRDLIIKCHKLTFGQPPSPYRLMILWAVLAFEHGAGPDLHAPKDGRAAWNVWNWNFGNRRGIRGNVGGYTATVPEIINGQSTPMTGVWPEFSDQVQGMVSWLNMMSTKYRLALAASLTGNVLAYSVAAKLAGYMTDPVTHYAAGVRVWAVFFSQHLKGS